MTHSDNPIPENAPLTLCLCGDVMIGRGIDQVLPHPAAPRLFERFVEDARDYVTLAERANGPIPVPVDPKYIWGDALDDLDRISPDLRIINLETSITQSNKAWPNKGINYRAGPRNIATLTTAKIDCCALANNHVLDWGRSGLLDTCKHLKKSQIRYAGAGATIEQAQEPAVLELPGKGRVLLFSCGVTDSGVPPEWNASSQSPGIYRLKELSQPYQEQIAAQIKQHRTTGDLVVLSIHWGDNWGYGIPRAQVEFAHRLIDDGLVDLIHGHSSHHIKGLELYRGKLILYGCGDLINDYEGIGGHEAFQPELALIYYATLDKRSGVLSSLKMSAFRMKRFQLQQASPEERDWIAHLLYQQSKIDRANINNTANNGLILQPC